MTIRFHCSGCQREFQVSDGMAGKRARCQSCQTIVTVPMPAAASEDLFADLSPAGPLAAPPASFPATTATRKPPARSSSVWYVRQWHWLAVAVILVLAAIPKVGLILAGLAAGIGILMVLIGGVAPFLRVIFGAPGTVLLMIVSRSARFEMMRQPDNHPYKVLVQSAFNPTRGLFWRGVLLIVAFIPAAFIHGAASEIFRHRGGGEIAAEPPVGPMRPRAGQQPVMPPQGGPAPMRAPGPPPLGKAPDDSRSDTRIAYVTVNYDDYAGPGDATTAVQTVLSTLPGLVPDSVAVDEAAKTIRFQNRGRLFPPEIQRSLQQQGFKSTRFRMSSTPDH